MSKEEQSWSEAYLAESFYHRGYLLEPNAMRKQSDGARYKKGYEVRFVACSVEELAEIRQCLQEAGFDLKRPYNRSKGKIVQPLYGKKNVERFKAIYMVWQEDQKKALLLLKEQHNHHG